jgi:hypothetical protein
MPRGIYSTLPVKLKDTSWRIVAPRHLFPRWQAP